MGKFMWDGKLYAAGTWVYKLALINVLWIGFTLLGGIVLGIFPATIAMFTVTRKWLTGREDIPTVKTFISTYKKEFLKGNIVGYVMVIIGFLFFFDIKFFQTFDSGIFYLNYLFVGLFIIYCLMMLFIFPVYVHFKLSVFQYIKHSFLMLVISPLRTLSLFLMAFVIYYLTTQFTPALIFFGISIQVLMMMWIALKVFRKIELKHSDSVELNGEV